MIEFFASREVHFSDTGVDDQSIAKLTSLEQDALMRSLAQEFGDVSTWDPQALRDAVDKFIRAYFRIQDIAR